MTNELKPLSDAEADEFAKRRQSSAVVQHKCAACGRWWETQRLEAAFTETFDCDCGVRLQFHVPAIEAKPLILKASTDDLLALNDGDQRLDTGMSVKEAISRAASWWQSKGAKLMRTEAKRQALPVGSADRGLGAVFASANPDDPNFLPSNLIHGKPWDELNRREKSMMVKAWHHFNVRSPQVLGDPEDPFKMQDRKKIN